MSGAFFDTSVLVPVVTEQLPNHTTSHRRFVNELGGKQPPCCSTHTLAECYATLTALPLPRRISGPEAARLIERNFVKNMRIVDLSTKDYLSAVHLCADSGRTSGQIYDALHVVAALNATCRRIYTFNLAHFNTLAQNRIEISTP
ncbi:MAG: PIN domain-containing protein [Kiritimatiellia bacterium]